MFREVVSRGFGALLVLLGVAGLVGIAYSLFFAGNAFRWNYLGAGGISLVVLFMGWARLFPRYYAPIPIDHGDPLMKRAIDEARREVARFTQGIKDGRKQPFVKFPLKSSGGEVEHIWGIVHTLDADVVQVSLANDPVHRQEQRDPRFSVALSDIEDWMLVDGKGVTEGGYTYLAMARMYKRQKGHVPRAMRNELAGFKDLDLDQLW
jgi:uncharacterized protein YegJ (DUF2314 family)